MSTIDNAAAFAANRRARTTVVTAPIDGIEVKVSKAERQRGMAALVAGMECTSLRVRVEDGD